MQLWQILVPTVRPDGRPFRLRYHRVWDAQVRAITGGLTILQPARGQWISPEGELFAERMIPVLLACSESQIEEIADFTAAYYSQKAVLYWLVSDRVVLRHYPSA
jgi:hypothetical protein